MASKSFEAVLRSRKRDPGVEARLIAGKDSMAAVRYASWVLRNNRWQAAEPLIIQNPWAAALYANHVLRHRWKAAEPVVLRDAKAALLYVEFVIRRRWKAAELLISQSRYAKPYAANVLPDRWDEEVAKKCPCWLYYYAKDVIGGKLPEKLHNLMFAEGIKNPNDLWVKKYFGAKKYQKVRKPRPLTYKKPPATP